MAKIKQLENKVGTRDNCDCLLAAPGLVLTQPLMSARYSSSGDVEPSSISQLAERALKNLYDPNKDLKHWLRVADRARNLGKEYLQAGDMENAFSEFAKAATLILDKMPSHREYQSRITAKQRESLALNGQEMLKYLSQLKSVITDRHNAWVAAHPNGSSSSTAPKESQPREPYRPERIERVESHTSYNEPQGYRTNPPEALRNGDQVRRERVSRRGSQDQYTNPRENPKQRVDEILSRVDERARSEHSAVLQRQREADLAASSARRALGPALNTTLPPTLLAGPFRTENRTNESPVQSHPILPLESPTRYEPPSNESSRDDKRLYDRIAELTIQPHSNTTPQAFVPPAFAITTTSVPPPTLTAIQYPQLMSHHQRAQGYTPSLQSMFVQPTNNPPPNSLLLDHALGSSLYSNILPTSSRNAPPDPRDYHPSQAQAPVIPPPPSFPTSLQPTRPYPNYPSKPASRPPTPPPRPPKEPIPPPEPEPPARIVSQPKKDKDPVSNELKTVQFPRETLSRFLSIASINTAQNRETCGLLLGKAWGDKYVVSTLLIPRQHSTSDTCTMDEEELVLEFTEQRSLITLGWIHTHPKQSCFMSSVDLHTHAGFQRMLPESFAVVCAPESTPNFGIFRLTDPPGLQVILSCHIGDAFHPHPDVPIYTDADKGHVQMGDMKLEIVDLR